uniref:TIL domain-containing protein n=1 Tax=Angiostrongylus cantonensis TaxID=6313 RepID=A0A0K0D0B4_ANGCA
MHFGLVVTTAQNFEILGNTCGPNEEFRECGISCEPKCNEEMPIVCTANCIINACQCKEGFKRGPKGCVKPGRDCQ